MYTGIANIRYLSSDNPGIQSASQYTQALEIFDYYHLIIQNSIRKVGHLYSDNPEIQSASLLHTSIENVGYLSSDNPEIPIFQSLFTGIENITYLGFSTEIFEISDNIHLPLA